MAQKKQQPAITSLEQTIGFIGAGNLAEALISGLISSNLVPADRIWASDVREERLEYMGEKYGINITEDNRKVVSVAQVVILTVKPQIIKQVLGEVNHLIDGDKLIISPIAGIPIRFIEKRLSGEVRIVRSMPNIACSVKEGATAICPGRHLKDGDLEITKAIFGSVGLVAKVTEDMMDAVTGLSGSGPAYIFLIIDALADAGVKVGLHRDVAQKLAAQTVKGAAQLMIVSGEHPGRLKDMVTSPGGTAIAGVATLESGGLRTTLINAVEAATNRSATLGGQSMQEKED